MIYDQEAFMKTEKKTIIGYLPLIVKGGGVFDDVFDWKSAVTIAETSKKVLSGLGYDTVFLNKPIVNSSDYHEAEKLFTEKKIDVLFVHTLNIAGGESLYRLIQHLNIPVLIAAVPEPETLFNPPYNNRYASYCGGQWNMNMMYLLGKKAKFLFGNPDEEQFVRELKASVRALNVIRDLEDWKVCVVGDKTQGYYGAVYSEDLLMRTFGSAVTYLDFGSLGQMMERIKDEQVEAFVKKSYPEKGVSAKLPLQHMKNSAKIFLALDRFAREEGISSFTMKCVPETIKVLGTAPCGINSLLTENGYISGCEGDVLATLSMYAAWRFSDRLPLMVDIMSLRSPDNDGSMLVWHCGAGAPSIAGKNAVTYRESPILTDGSGEPQGVCVDFLPDFQKVTMSQLTETWKNGSYRYFAVEGDAVPTDPFIGGNSLKIRFGIDGEALGRRIVDLALPHHFQISDGSIVHVIKEFSNWKDIPFIE
jgi:L-fucose isomerase-like protein